MTFWGGFIYLRRPLWTSLGFITWLLLPFPLLNLHPEGASNTEPSRALKGGVSSHVSGRQQVQGGMGVVGRCGWGFKTQAALAYISLR